MRENSVGCRVPRLGGQFNQFVPEGKDDELEPTGNFQFAEDRCEMVAHSRQADKKKLGNFLILEPLANEIDNLALPFGK